MILLLKEKVIFLSLFYKKYNKKREMSRNNFQPYTLSYGEVMYLNLQLKKAQSKEREDKKIQSKGIWNYLKSFYKKT
jgi:hypothetical protein